MTTLKQIRELLDKSKNPLYFFDDDPDGVVSYLLLRRRFGKGNGVIIRVKGTHLDEQELYLSKIIEHSPDVVVFLDKPTLTQEVFDKINVKKIWIDHHDVVDVKGVYYYNPRMKDKHDNRPTSYLCYKVSGKDLWLANVGVVADWSLALFKEFEKKYPNLTLGLKKLNKSKILPDDVLYNTKIGELARMFSFVLKGKTIDVKKNIKMLLTIESPEDILEQKTLEGKFLFKSAMKFKGKYDLLIDSAMKDGKKSTRVLVFSYVLNETSFTSDLANELIHRFPDKIVAVGRHRDERMRFSLRSSTRDIELPPLIEKLKEDLDCSGGGHEHAAAIEIHHDDFRKFSKLLRKHVT